MKKFLLVFVITYLISSINGSAISQNEIENFDEDHKVLKIGILVPLSGEFQAIGQSVLNAVKLAIFDLEKKNIKIFPKDSKGNPEDTYLAAKELESEGIKIVVGPIFHQNLAKLNQLNELTFLSLTNKTLQLPRNSISFGININSQIKAIKKYLDDNNLSKTLLLIPKSEFENDIKKIVLKENFGFYKSYSYDTNPQKITSQVETITNHRQRKINLSARKKMLEKSELEKDRRELKTLEQKHTLGNVDFDSVLVTDFGERLKSVLSSFVFSDVTSKNVKFFTLNQWFDESLFQEASMDNLFFPSIDLENFNWFRKKYFETFDQISSEIAILAYDNIGLIYYTWVNNDYDFRLNKLKTKEGFKGLQGHFFIKENSSQQILNIYKISKNNFKKVN